MADRSKSEEQYKQYLEKHIGGVQFAYQLLVENGIVAYDSETSELIKNHDQSKYGPEEWEGYLDHFYLHTPKADEKFKLAWLHHQNHNPHHPQYWCLQEDDKPGELECIDMPEKYIIEMLCDWMSFAVNAHDLNEVQKWYKNDCKHLMSRKTKKRVEELLERVKTIKEPNWEALNEVE